MYMRTLCASAALSAIRRARYSDRSHASGSSPGFWMRPCQIVGIVSRARSPSESASTGTGRQAPTRRCCSTSPRARPSHSNRTITARSSPSSFRGTWISSPAPSPLLPSASRPPRCASRASACTPRATDSWPSPGVATKPMPQAARASGRSPGQARRVRSSAGGTDTEGYRALPGVASARSPKESAIRYAVATSRGGPGRGGRRTGSAASPGPRGPGQ